MKLDNRRLEQIVRFLNLEKIMVKQITELTLFPIVTDEEFEGRLEILKENFKGVIFRVVEEGEYKHVEINVPKPLTSNGSS